MTEKQVYFGTVVWFGAGGYGFIKGDDEDEDKFVHWTQINDDTGKFKKLVAGQRVTFQLGANKNGPQAENVTVIKNEE